MERDVGYNEDEVKRRLGIETWRNLSKDKMLRFAAMMPDIDTEVALKIVEQFPAFTAFALDAVKVMEQAHAATLSVNDRSQDRVYQALQEIREILKGELDRNDLSWDERKFLIEQIQETGKLAFKKDSESKHFLDGLLKTVGMVGIAALALGVVFVGGKMMLEEGDSNDELLDA